MNEETTNIACPLLYVTNTLCNSYIYVMIMIEFFLGGKGVGGKKYALFSIKKIYWHLINTN